MWRHLLSTGVVLMLFCATTLVGDVPGGSVLSNEPPWDSEDGDFKAWLGVTLDTHRLVKISDAPDRHPTPIPVGVSRVVPEQNFAIFLLFAGCKAAVDGNCHTTSTYEILLPDGSVAVSREHLPVWPWSAPKPGRVELSRAIWVTSAEASDPPGTNRIRATVTDHIAKKTLVLERQLVLEKP